MKTEWKTAGQACFLEVGGRPSVRFVRDYTAPAEMVWAAVAEPEGLASWFPAPEVEFEPRPGAPMRFSGAPVAPEAVSTGTVLVVEQGSSLRFDWGGDELWFDVVPVGDGARFTLTNVLAEEDAAARNAAGWHMCLAALDTRFGESEENPPADWREALQRYADAGFPQGAPVPGNE